MNWLCEECFISHILNIIYIYIYIYIQLYTYVYYIHVSYHMMYHMMYHMDSYGFIRIQLNSYGLMLIQLIYLTCCFTRQRSSYAIFTSLVFSSRVALRSVHVMETKRNGEAMDRLEHGLCRMPTLYSSLHMYIIYYNMCI